MRNNQLQVSARQVGSRICFVTFICFYLVKHHIIANNSATIEAREKKNMSGILRFLMYVWLNLKKKQIILHNEISPVKGCHKGGWPHNCQHNNTPHDTFQRNNEREQHSTSSGVILRIIMPTSCLFLMSFFVVMLGVVVLCEQQSMSTKFFGLALHRWFGSLKTCHF